MEGGPNLNIKVGQTGLSKAYVAFVGQTSGCEVEAREIAVEMLEQFMATDRDFRQWQKLAQKSVFESRESRIEKSPSDEWARSRVRNYGARFS